MMTATIFPRFRPGAILAGLLVLAACEPERAYPDAPPDAFQPWDLPVQQDPGAPEATWADDGPRDLALPDEGGDPDVRSDAGGPPGERLDCQPCTTDLDCGGDARCIPVGATKHCLHDCGDDGDCPPSYVCYAATSDGKSCLPVSYSCVDCAWEAPCSGDQTCDFVSGKCRDPVGFCCPCRYDFDCGAGLRCFRKAGNPTGACVVECSATRPCQDSANFTCREDSSGVPVCQPTDSTSCGGCQPDRPFPAGDCANCYECLNNSHCDVSRGEVCDPVTHDCTMYGCGSSVCGSGLFKCGDCQCHSCCQDADCRAGEGPCEDGLCVNAGDPCQDQCVDAFPVCAILNSIAQCVQCLADADCAAIDSACTCTGDPTYSCLALDGSVCTQPSIPEPCTADADCQKLDPTCTCTGDPTWRCLFPDGEPCAGPACPAICTTDGDCPPSPWGGTLACSDVGGGFCRSPDGRCDDLSACCGAGRQCLVLVPGSPAPASVAPRAYCTCDDAHPCPGGLPCTAVADLCALPGVGATVCPGGVPPADLPPRMCVDPAALAGEPSP